MQPDSQNIFTDRFQAGEVRAYEEIFQLYFNALIIFARHIVFDQPATEDIVTDAFVKLYQLRREVNTINNIKAFLYITVRNGCLNYLRHQKVKEKYQLEHRHSIQAEENAYEQKEIEEHLLKTIHAVVEDLPECRQRIFRMSYVEGLSDYEIASRLAIAQATVRQHRCLAIRDIRNSINRLKLNTLI
jgi:RNA polymerase sigma-70 factor (ECF subfamily)